MNFAKINTWAISLVGIFSTALLALLLCLISNSSVQAADEQLISRQETVYSAAPKDSPPIYYIVYLTYPIWFDLNWYQIDGGAVEAVAQSDETGRVSGQASLQRAAPVQLEFTQVEAILRDANQNPIGVVMSGRGTTSNGRAFSFTYTTQRTPDGRCCAVEIRATEIHPSGGVRFEAAGELRFE